MLEAYEYLYHAHGGLYSDTASQDYDRLASFALIDMASSLAYEDYAQSPHPFTLNVTSNNGNTINATFSGIVYREAGTGPDSLMISSNGHFAVTL